MTDQVNATLSAKLAAMTLDKIPLLRTKLSRALFCSAAETDRALAEVIKFLTLAAENSRGALTPSARVDVAWHEFILFTRTYQHFCELQFGKLIHHEPSANHELNSSQYAETLQRYRERFGEPPADFWGGSSTAKPNIATAFCGNCESNT